jgi:predicted O-methyltransferase YrrM
MNADQVTERLEQLNYQQLTSATAGALLYEFVLESEIEDVLELGTGNGTSTCYIAAALQEKGRGRVTTMDRTEALSREPNVFALLDRLGVGDRVDVVLAERSYDWELMKLIERQTRGSRTEPCFDFCFVDGAHTWETDGFAFFLGDKLLRDDSWILFDDVHWTHAASPTLAGTEVVEAMPNEERITPQVLRIIGLLVLQHPSYSNVRLAGNYAWAYKRGESAQGVNEHAVARLGELEAALNTTIRAQVRRRPKAPS